MVVLSQLAASPGSGVARLIFLGSYGFWAREDLAEPQLDRPYGPAPLAVPETTGQAGQPPRHPKVLCDFGPSAKTGRQSAAPTATLLEQNLQMRTAAGPSEADPLPVRPVAPAPVYHGS